MAGPGVEGRGDGLNLDWVTPELAVGGAFATSEVPVLAAQGISAVVDLRSEGCDEARALEATSIAFLHLPTEDHCALSLADMDAGVAFVLPRIARSEKVLVHCREGIGRSVTLCLCVMVAQGWAPLPAMLRIKERRYWASPSPAQFDAFAAWLARRGVEPPPFPSLAAIAYLHLR